MKSGIEHYLTNWSNGMKISGSHFIDSENALIDLIRDSNSASHYIHNFGLLPMAGSEPSLQLDVVESRSKYIKVRLSLCRAITQEGVRIDISPSLINSFKDYGYHEAEVDTTNLNSNSFDVVLLVNPFDRMIFQAPDGNETPVRFQSTAPFFKLGILPTNHVNTSDQGKFAFVVGRLNFLGDNGVLDQTYIPACMAVGSHPVLMEHYQKLAKNLLECQKNSFTIIQNVLGKKQNSELANNVKNTCEEIVRFVADISFEYENAGSLLPPFYLINTYIKLAKRIRAQFQMVLRREELVMYYTKWLEISQGNFENLITETTKFSYTHTNVFEPLQKIEHFMTQLNKLLNQLSQLDILEEKGNKSSFILSQKDIGGGGDGGYNMFAD